MPLAVPFDFAVLQPLYTFQWNVVCGNRKFLVQGRKEAESVLAKAHLSWTGKLGWLP